METRLVIHENTLYEIDVACWKKRKEGVSWENEKVNQKEKGSKVEEKKGF